MAAEKNGYRRTKLVNNEKTESSNNLFLGTAGSTPEPPWMDGGVEDVLDILRVNVVGCVGPGRFVDRSVN